MQALTYGAIIMGFMFTFGFVDIALIVKKSKFIDFLVVMVFAIIYAIIMIGCIKEYWVLY
ncbi:MULTISPECIES: hypothetical protein [Bacillus cereus group]|uniref:Uncharacterized protein n=1 Tax=Bacillus thuringiensis TaxID=1428 RepID=A0A9X7ASB4_BACTU|nr:MULTISPECIES: hypothetical protein [Bacillus cereus group]EKS7858207.1 hypothetical protein [Bacillus cereus]MDM5370403.1 hypothetical protein [Bacillus bombysepticus]PEV64122.1 hypothetical protein CN434_25275 [Bacillus thuringiensis]PFT50854.1 hypothetical protein COK72_02270 [Bacillus thuringiensis]PFY22891.1 hypothetical protein COL44_18590 [Bacillus toyonensis]